jgi:hypothetical protein
MKIIDVHSHIGNILYKNGGDLIFEEDIPDRNLFDTGFKFRNLIDAGFYAALLKYRSNGYKPNKIIREWATWSGRQRNFAANYNNLKKSLDNNNITYACVLPIPPYVYFKDVLKISYYDNRIIPFTGIDFTNFEESISGLEKEILAGARGLKLHPIIQKVSLIDEKLMYAVDEFSKYDFPILFHSGYVTYYHGEEKKTKEIPEYGNIDDAKSLIKNFPKAKFIVGHSGLLQVDEVIKKLKGLDNVYLDTSFQSPEKIRELIDVFGEDKIMYASDWPYGDRKKSIEIMKEALGNDEKITNKIFYENAYNLLKLYNIK